ncbi:MAG: type II toxin-antitoxin system YafQ family toxin [Actinomycetaceae bacterium]|nr:type II toxin-antitoxin system YafQ family toxin [Actinomycetaceae bacterium]
MKYSIKFTKSFKKDLKKAQKQGKDLDLLWGVVEKLANAEPLEEKYRDHHLTGNKKRLRECHIESDWLLIYAVYDDVLVLALNRVGSHSELFKK